MQWLANVVLLLGTIGIGPVVLQGQELDLDRPATPPAGAAEQFAIADGLSATLFAAEPMVAQPVSISFDDRGGMWVVQYLQYPHPAGLKAVEADQYLRTKYDHVPPPRRRRGRAASTPSRF